jgi:hypothetical protein
MTERSSISYTLGILSIVLAFFQPIAALIIGIIGLSNSKKSPDELSKKARKLNIWGIVLSAIVLIASIIYMVYLVSQGVASSAVINALPA